MSPRLFPFTFHFRPFPFLPPALTSLWRLLPFILPSFSSPLKYSGPFRRGRAYTCTVGTTCSILYRCGTPCQFFQGIQILLNYSSPHSTPSAYRAVRNGNCPLLSLLLPSFRSLPLPLNLLDFDVPHSSYFLPFPISSSPVPFIFHSLKWWDRCVA